MSSINLRLRVTLPALLTLLLAASPTAAAQTFPAPSLSLDTFFAPELGGIAKTDFPQPNTAGTLHDIPAAVAVHGNRIYTVGVSGTSTTGDGRDVAIAARLATGELDTGFSGDGKLTFAVGAEADIGTGIAVLPDGRLRVIVATDLSAASDTVFDVAVVGLNGDGTPDATFGELAGGIRRVILAPGPNSDVPARIVPGHDGHLAIVGSRSDGTRDDLFVAMLDQEGDPVTGPAEGFGTTGIAFTPTTSVGDRGVDVVFLPDGRLVVWTSVDPAATPDEGVLRAFNADGTVDTTFGNGGQLVVGSSDTVPGGLILYRGRLWMSGATKIGSDTDAFIARANTNGTGLQVRRFDMRGRFVPAAQAVVSESHDLVAVPGAPETLVAVGSVTYSIDASGPFVDWAAAAFNGLDDSLESAGFGDVVLQAPGSGELVSAAAASPGWLAVAGTHVDSDNNFGNARLLIDAEKACDLAVSAGEPGEIVFQGSRPAALTVRVQNVGTRPCAGTVSLAGPYGMAPIGTGVVAAGGTFTATAVPVTYHGPRRADDVLQIVLDAPDANTANNRAVAHVVFSFCDLAVEPVGRTGAIPSEGTRRFELSLRNQGTATCRVRVGSGAPYSLARARSASDALAVGAPTGARPGTRVSVVLRASATNDVNPADNAVTVRPKLVRVGDSDVRSSSSRGLAGTARRGVGDLPASRLRPARVDVAVVREGSGCAWLNSARGTFTKRKRGRDGDCGDPRWVRAVGTASWRLRLSGSLPNGRYVIYSRVTIGAGFSEASFSAKDRNKVAVTIG